MRMLRSRERRSVQEYLLEFKVDIGVLEGELVRIEKKVFLVDKEVLKKARDIGKMGKSPYALGVEIGVLSEGFEPSLELAEIISKYTEEKTVINEEGEKLFSYGRDVFLQNIVKGKEEGNRIVVNGRNEVLGFGYFDGKMLKNVIDKGFYLRGKRGRR